MQYTDEQIQKMLELKESIIDKMAKHQEELDFLEKNLEVLDVILKGSSFTKASSLPRDEKPTQNVEVGKKNKPESIPIKKNKDGEIIANAFVTPEQVSIILNEGMSLTDETPPLRTFFIERIIGEMKKIDSADVKDGKIDPSYSEKDTADYMKNSDIEINVKIVTGSKSFIAYTMDLTKKYIEINADYRS